MYLAYIDESGDTGLPGSSTHFILTALVVHEWRWLPVLDAVLQFRRDLRLRYGFKLREELHAEKLIYHPGEAGRIAKSLRLHMLGDVLNFIGFLSDVSIVNVVVNKAGKPDTYDVFDYAWGTLIQRLHMGTTKRTFSGPANSDERMLLVVDRTDELRLRLLTRRLRRFNPVPSRLGGTRPMPMHLLVEDPVHRDSSHSYFIQLADVVSYFLKQSLQASKYVRKKGAKNWFMRTEPVLYRAASSTNPLGIVHL